MIINNNKAFFAILGTGDGWGLKDKPYLFSGKGYDLSFFNKIFLKNDIEILKEVFLDENINISKSNFYEYNRMGSSIVKSYGDLPEFMNRIKDLDEICINITNIYKRLYKELPNDRETTIDKFALILATLNIANCEFVRKDCKECLPIIKYIEQFTDNKEDRISIYNNAYNKLEEFNADYYDNLDDYDEYEDFYDRINCDNVIRTKEINAVKELDKNYARGVSQSKNKYNTNKKVLLDNKQDSGMEL